MVQIKIEMLAQGKRSHRILFEVQSASAEDNSEGYWTRTIGDMLDLAEAFLRNAKVGRGNDLMKDAQEESDE